jgi:hypothetical protein
MATFIVSTLSKEAAKQALIRWTPILLAGVTTASSVITDHRTRQAAKAATKAEESRKKSNDADTVVAELLQKTLEETTELDEEVTEELLQEILMNNIMDLASKVEPKRVNVMQYSYISAGPYTTTFAAMAVVAIILEVHQGIEALKKMGKGIDGIREALDIQTNGIIQGWGPDGFGGFVYDFIDMEIQKAISNDPKKEHWFYVYHPDTAWRVKFEKLLRPAPEGRGRLPPALMTVDNDLDTIFLLMLDNRMNLQNSNEGRDVLFHLLIPAYKPLLIEPPLIIDSFLFPLEIKGHVHNSDKNVWLNLPEVPEGLDLPGIGNLARSEETKNGFAGLVAFSSTVGSMYLTGLGLAAVEAAAVPVLGILTPVVVIPLMPVAVFSACYAGWFAGSTAKALTESKPPKPRIVGRPLFRGPASRGGT